MSERLPGLALHPKIRLTWTLGALGVWAAAMVTALSISIPAGVSVAIPAGAGAVTLVVALTLPTVHYRSWRYEIRQNDVFLSKGWIVRTLSLMPFDRIQFVETKQGPLDRLFALQQLVIKTAGGSISIPGLTTDEATRLRERLSSVVGTMSV